MQLVPDMGVMLDGHDTPKAQARTTAAEYLVAAHNWSVVDADDACEDAAVSRAWWCGDDVGFGGQDHPDAQPVTVVNVAVQQPV